MSHLGTKFFAIGLKADFLLPEMPLGMSMHDGDTLLIGREYCCDSHHLIGF